MNWHLARELIQLGWLVATVAGGIAKYHWKRPARSNRQAMRQAKRERKRALRHEPRNMVHCKHLCTYDGTDEMPMTALIDWWVAHYECPPGSHELMAR